MPDDIQDNIQKLTDLSTRIDERVKSIQSTQVDVNSRIDAIIKSHTEILQKIAVLEDRGSGKDFADLDKRLVLVETKSINTEDRWNKIFTFIIQLIWVILAAYLLTKLNLQAPAVP